MTFTVVGMISGTSYDAIDAAVADFELDGNTVRLRPRGLHSEALDAGLRTRIADCLPPNNTTIEEVCKLDTEIGQRFGAVARDTIAEFAPEGVDLVVSHGQTVFHWVEGLRCLGTLQLGAAAWVAEIAASPVLSDVRSRDITRGGQGAPLASTLDGLLLLGDGTKRGSLNLGGISNITVRNRAGAVIAYDIGPASALMDAAVTEITDGRMRMDADGAMAARGTVDEQFLAQLLNEPYYRLEPPKSTGKELFHIGYLREHLAGRTITEDDLLATLTELTARTVAEACERYGVDELIVAGGGVRNPTLMGRIGELIAPVKVLPFEQVGLPSQGKEAYMFALIGCLSAHGLEGTIASATGATEGSILGSFTPGVGPLVLPAPWPTPIERLVIER